MLAESRLYLDLKFSFDVKYRIVPLPTIVIIWSAGVVKCFIR